MDSAPLPPTGPPSRDGNSSRIKRANQACLNCRKRKSRCLLDSDGGIPCLRCKRDNLECILGGSNRGGRRVRRKTLDPQILPSPNTYNQEDSGFHGVGNVGTSPWTHSGAQDPAVESSQQRRSRDGQLPRSRSSSTPDDINFPNLQNPSDALGILARVAETSTGERDASTNGHRPPQSTPAMAQPRDMPQAQQIPYRPLELGVLTIPKISQLLMRYHQHYHPYYPLAPSQTFDTSRLAETAQREPHLLTAILVISSKDLVDEPKTYESCTEYMKLLVSNLAAGGDADVEAVEALLLLAEWAPYTQRASGKVGRGEEDKESWMHVGLALRIGYFLGLDKYSFRVIDDGKDSQHDRKRLVWTACYISDRHISIRIGKAFWSRGPGPLTTLRREDYPSLLPQSPNEEDYASIFQASLELTQLFSNVHDVLYSNPGSSFRSHLSGGYIKFIDDFRSAIYGWKSVWGTLTCSPPLKATLLMSYDYLRLYTNAFAFQATVRRALPAAAQSTSDPSAANAPLAPLPNHAIQAPSRVFYNNVGAVGDARFIYEGLDAAKAILTTANNFVDPEKSLRFMPLRFYLYLVYAGVFLYRARCVGVIGSEEERAVRAMIQETVARLQRSSVGSSSGMQHPGSRYSQLLKLLWAKVGHKDKSRAQSNAFTPGSSVNAPRMPMDNNGIPATQTSGAPGPPPSLAGSGTTGGSPAVTDQMGDFSWTDLMAVGEFAMNGSGGAGLGGQPEDGGLLAGFLPLDLGLGMGIVGQGAGWENGGFEGGELGMSF
ncbi:hypothetical protein K432DRAFT_439153 [Lepidopterella palustris CBS 459.81]|uniref:Zn(2)-C6 fungal-type domain-containing protein n=1 Tax=Lepidopterella palustris CBS 459.81 TaxID=1314670 RepID=A0A8E2EKR6_9PEZI|nr:hypothetical protein K432DRAFT_439153 [Lepidopterella palustris CBS 459.81]